MLLQVSHYLQTVISCSTPVFLRVLLIQAGGGWFTPFWFSPNVENTSRSPWVLLSHCLAFKSFKHLYELPVRQDAACGAEGRHSTARRSLLTCPPLWLPGSTIQAAPSQNRGPFLPPKAVTEGGRFGEPALRSEEGIPRWQSQFRCIPDVLQMWTIVLTVTATGHLFPPSESHVLQILHLFLHDGTLLNVHLSHAPLHMDRWKLHLFYVVFLQLLLTNKKLFARGIFHSSFSVPNLETGKHPGRRHKLQPSPATSPYHCFLCFKEEIGRNFTPFICVRRGNRLLMTVLPSRALLSRQEFRSLELEYLELQI